MGIDQLRIAGQRHRHRVDREVAAGEVGGERRRADLGERAGVSVGLAARRRQVDLEAVDAHGRGVEALVGAHLPTEPPGQLAHLALDGDVDVRPLAGQAADRARRRRPDRRRSRSRPRAGARSRAAPPGAPRVARARSWRWGATSRLLYGAFGPVPYHDGLRGWLACSTSGAPGASGAGLPWPAAPPSSVAGAAIAVYLITKRPEDVSNPDAAFQQAEAGGDQDGRLAALRPRPRSAPATCRPRT